MKQNIYIDDKAGFCSGVTRAIDMAEHELNSNRQIFCLGSIVHNSMEEKRLLEKGLMTIRLEDFNKLNGANVLIRAHGEPPITYNNAKNNDIKIIDATCPVVLNVQHKIKTTFLNNSNAQIIIFGKKGHAEVNGLVGQTNNTAVVVSDRDDYSIIDFSKSIFLFAQTTANYIEYEKLINYLNEQSIKLYGNIDKININQTICPSVIRRIPDIKKFCIKHDTIIFVSDKFSSNGKMLFKICKETNKSSYFISNSLDLKIEWFKQSKSIGISGATSTPYWLMQEVQKSISDLLAE